MSGLCCVFDGDKNLHQKFPQLTSCYASSARLAVCPSLSQLLAKGNGITMLGLTRSWLILWSWRKIHFPWAWYYQKKNKTKQNKKLVPHKLGKKEGMAVERNQWCLPYPYFWFL